jgi:hypothetical protein
VKRSLCRPHSRGGRVWTGISTVILLTSDPPTRHHSGLNTRELSVFLAWRRSVVQASALWLGRGALKLKAHDTFVAYGWRTGVDALETASAEFAKMRIWPLRFRGLLRGGTVEKLGVWLRDARRFGICGMQRIARALRHDIEPCGMPCWKRGAMGKPKARSTGSRR